MREIPLTQGQVALVDDEDHDRVARFKWCADRRPEGGFYAKRSIWVPETRSSTTQSMHRFILSGCTAPHIDHWDLNGLNNQKANLRPCTVSQNAMNRTAQRNSKSGVKGVIWDKQHGLWFAQIRIRGKAARLGYFRTVEAAATAYAEAAARYHGQFARTKI